MGENHKNNPQRHHIVIIIPPYQGHINPTIQLSLKLASKGFIITFVNTEWTHDQITKSKKYPNDNIFYRAHELGLDIRYHTISDGFPLSFDRSWNFDEFVEGMLLAFPGLVDELVGRLIEQSDTPPDCLVVDTFFTWGSTVARKYGLVFVSFWMQPALVLTTLYHMDLLKKNGHYGFQDERNLNTIDYLPGVKNLEPKDLMLFLQETDISKPMHRALDMAFTDLKQADFIICNTVQELEPETIHAFNERQPTYAIGPLLPAQFNIRTVEMNLWSESDCSQWLDSKIQGSVLYASFGSFAHSNKDVIMEIANGLMNSGVNFIWILRPNVVSSEVSDCLPDRFLESVGDRGLVLPWCNQNVVLSHPAIGGFFTHCGWNSILESVWCGLPMICFPLIVDQTTNRKLVVDDWKIGINLCDEKTISSGEVEEKIKYFMSDKILPELKNATLRTRKKLEDALSSNGSSQTNFDEFVECVKAKVEKLKNR